VANTLTNFLVGIGWDMTQYDQGTKHIHSSLGSIKSTVLQTGVALAGAFGIKALTTDFADMADQAGKFGQVYGVAASDLTSFGKAIEFAGGNASTAFSTLANIEKLRAGLLTGDTGWIATAARAGIDTRDILSATDAFQAMLALSDQFQGMSLQQRLNASQALGLDDATLRLLSGGRDQMMAVIETMRQGRPLIEDTTKAAAQFNQGLVTLQNNVGGVADKISIVLLPKLTDIIDGTNEWYAANQNLVNQGLDKALEPIADNFGAITASVALLAAGSTLGTISKLAQYIPGIGGGLSMAAGAAARLSGIGAAAGVSVAAADVIDKQLQDAPWYQRLNEFVSQKAFDITGYFPAQDFQFIPEGDPRLGGRTRNPVLPDITPMYQGMKRDFIFPTSNEGDDKKTQGSVFPDLNLMYQGMKRDFVFPDFNARDYQFALPDMSSLPGWGFQAAPLRPQPTVVNVNAKLEMDGRVIDEKVISVMSDQNQAAVEDLQSTTER